MRGGIVGNNALIDRIVPRTPAMCGRYAEVAFTGVASGSTHVEMNALR